MELVDGAYGCWSERRILTQRRKVAKERKEGPVAPRGKFHFPNFITATAEFFPWRNPAVLSDFFYTYARPSNMRLFTTPFALLCVFASKSFAHSSIRNASPLAFSVPLWLCGEKMVANWNVNVVIAGAVRFPAMVWAGWHSLVYCCSSYRRLPLKRASSHSWGSLPVV